LDRPKKKEAVKKVIAAMTVGKDVSMLFPHVVNCMQTEDLELKKLVYLYLINYAKTQPDLAIMAVNTFVKVGGGSCVCMTAPQHRHVPQQCQRCTHHSCARGNSLCSLLPHRTPKTPTRSSGRWQSGRWGASG
jgi:hypothetical protein